MNQRAILKFLTRHLRDGVHATLNLARLLLDPFEKARLRRRLAQGPICQVRCLEPWRRLDFMDRGIVTSCCQAFTTVHSVGNVKRRSIAQIWNGAVLQRTRRRLLLGEVGKVCRPFCPALRYPPVNVAELPETTAEERMFKEDLSAGRTALRAAPAYFVLSNWGACNLRCAMCDSWSTKRLPPFVQRTYEQLQGFFDRPITLKLTGSGDPLARRDTRDLLLKLSAEKNTAVRVELLTNGLLFTPAMWQKIKDCHYTFINVSIDAATPETYAKIRRGGRWEALLAALDLIRQARDAGHFEYVVINMTVMRSNFREIPAFIALARRYGFVAAFDPVRGHYGDENIFALGDRAALAELAQILAPLDPAAPDVYLNTLLPYAAPR